MEHGVVTWSITSLAGCKARRTRRSDPVGKQTSITSDRASRVVFSLGRRAQLIPCISADDPPRQLRWTNGGGLRGCHGRWILGTQAGSRFGACRLGEVGRQAIIGGVTGRWRNCGEIGYAACGSCLRLPVSMAGPDGKVLDATGRTATAGAAAGGIWNLYRSTHVSRGTTMFCSGDVNGFHSGEFWSTDLPHGIAQVRED